MASVHLEKGEEAGEWEEGGLAKSPRRIPARGWPGGPELPPSQEASCSRRFSSLCGAGADWLGLRGVAFGPSGHVAVSPLGRVLRAAAPVGRGQQALPLGFVVGQVA